MKKAFELPHCDVMMAMGGGAVIDCGKYMAFYDKCRFLAYRHLRQMTGLQAQTARYLSTVKNNRSR